MWGQLWVPPPAKSRASWQTVELHEIIFSLELLSQFATRCQKTMNLLPTFLKKKFPWRQLEVQMCLDVQSLRKHMNEYEFEFVLQKLKICYIFGKQGISNMTWHLVMAKEKGHLQTPSSFFAVAANGLDPPISFNSTSLQSEEFLGLKEAGNAVTNLLWFLFLPCWPPKLLHQKVPPKIFHQRIFR